MTLEQVSGFIESMRRLAARRRINLNRIVLVFVLVFLTRPRNRVFFILGLTVALAGALLRIWARISPGWRRESLPGAPASPAGVSLMKTLSSGPYRIVRHPMYLGTMIEAVGIWVSCFSFGRMFSALFLGVFLALYFFFVYKEAVLIEEEELLVRWPLEWQDYSAVTPALIATKESLRFLVWPDWSALDWKNIETTREWKNFLAYLGVFAFLWFKLVYKI
ncbi:MAG: hypothetical protein AAB091_05670 [Elusimicrobiota bacterium]